MITLGRMYEHTLKGGMEQRLRSAHFEIDGMGHDRQFMVVDAASGMFVAQRNNPKEQIGIAIPQICMMELTIGSLSRSMLHAPGMLRTELTIHATEPRLVQVWSWKGTALDCGNQAGEVVTHYLSQFRPSTYRLVRMSRIPKYQRHAKLGTALQRFNDAFPVHGISLASIADLNQRRQEAGKPEVPTNRFRANMLFDGCEPYQEDRIRRFRSCGIEFVWTKGCDRCVGINIDQENGVYDSDGPLGDLARYRRWTDGKIYFGVNFNHCGTGMLEEGAPVEVLEWAS